PDHRDLHSFPTRRSSDLEFRAVNENVQSLESALTRRVEQIASIILPAHATESAAQFQKIEDGIDAIRASESVNHRLFDSLHEELDRKSTRLNSSHLVISY